MWLLPSYYPNSGCQYQVHVLPSQSQLPYGVGLFVGFGEVQQFGSITLGVTIAFSLVAGDFFFAMIIL